MGSTSALLALPREIRDIVYEMVCDGFEVQAEQSDFSLRNSGILTACKQLRAESIATYYRRSIFYFASDDRCFNWLRLLSPKHRVLVIAIKIDTLKIYMPYNESTDFTVYRWISNRVADYAMEGFRLRLLGAGIALRGGVLFKNDLDQHGRIQWTREPLMSGDCGDGMRPDAKRDRVRDEQMT